MKNTARLGDICTGHGCWPPRPNVQGSPNVCTNGIPNHRKTDAWAPHTCPPIPQTHSSILCEGSPTVFTNGLEQGRVGDPVCCGSFIATGSPNHCTGDGNAIVLNVAAIIFVDAFNNTTIFTTEDTFIIETDTPEESNPPIVNENQPPLQEPIEEDETEPPEPDEIVEADCGMIPVPTPDSYQLSPNFTLGDLSSQTVFGLQAGQSSGPVVAQNGLSESDIVCNLKALAENVLEPLVALYGRQNMVLTSGFRQGSSNSQHNKGEAIDIQWSDIQRDGYYDRAVEIKNSGIPFDQFILEYGNNNPWHHISFSRTKTEQRRSILTYNVRRSGNKYSPGLTNFA